MKKILIFAILLMSAFSANALVLSSTDSYGTKYYYSSYPIRLGAVFVYHFRTRALFEVKP